MTFNVEIMCPRCGTIIKAAIKSHDWIRCPKCHLGVHVWKNMFGPSEKMEAGA